MAIKRTLGRSKFVTPSNIVVDSGGQAMAQATDNIGKAIGNIGETIDTSQLQTAILEAEKQGKLIGARTHKVYDSSGNSTVVPKPLSAMDLNSLFQPNLYNIIKQKPKLILKNRLFFLMEKRYLTML